MDSYAHACSQTHRHVSDHKHPAWFKEMQSDPDAYQNIPEPLTLAKIPEPHIWNTIYTYLTWLFCSKHA